MKIALAQIDSAPGDLQANLDKHLDFIRQAIQQKAELIVFPELSLTGEKIGPHVADVSLSIESEELLGISEASNEIDIVIGLAEKSEINLYNRFNTSFYLSGAALVHRHRKLFLVNYSVFDEGKHYVPGNNLQAFDARAGRMCMLICNDAWHAAMPYIAALDGAELMIVPANSARETLEDDLDIPQTWEHMNRAYSGMTGMYTIFVNRVGVRKSLYGDFPYWGGSEIISPRGEVIVKAPYDEEALIFGEVDISLVAQQRYNAPILRDARLFIVEQEIARLAEKRAGEVMLENEAIPISPDGVD
jgi:predicted amidohydrolase